MHQVASPTHIHIHPPPPPHTPMPPPPPPHTHPPHTFPDVRKQLLFCNTGGPKCHTHCVCILPCALVMFYGMTSSSCGNIHTLVPRGLGNDKRQTIGRSYNSEERHGRVDLPTSGAANGGCEYSEIQCKSIVTEEQALGLGTNTELAPE